MARKAKQGSLTTPLLEDVEQEAYVSQPMSKLMTAECGTREWMAPELCKAVLLVKKKYDAVGSADRDYQEALQSYYQHRDANSNTSYSQKVDVYAFSMIMVELILHLPPWSNEQDEDDTTVFHKVVRGERPVIPQQVLAAAPEGWQDLMELCWQEEPSIRPSFENALSNLQKLLLKRSKRRSTTSSWQATRGQATADASEMSGTESFALQVKSPRGNMAQSLQEHLL